MAIVVGQVVFKCFRSNTYNKIPKLLIRLDLLLSVNPLDPTFTKKRGRGAVIVNKGWFPRSVPNLARRGESKLG
jgi:hypothetical protein